MEHFYTIQGEGNFTGVAAYFIRLAGCDVGCVWCDVKESWNADDHPVLAVEDLVSLAAGSPGNTVVITGGEPLMYELGPITAALKTAGKRVHIETSGAHPVSGEWDWVCFSPKKFKAPHPSVFDKANELKIVVFNKSDFEFAEKYAALVNPNCQLFLQPEWGKEKVMAELVVEYVKANPKWRISLQTHKYLNIP
ncbi:MAG: 7-carboxy-7-deazaguanine synthase QueE [Bacteroidota bacterium]